MNKKCIFYLSNGVAKKKKKRTPNSEEHLITKLSRK